MYAMVTTEHDFGEVAINSLLVCRRLVPVYTGMAFDSALPQQQPF